MATVTLPAGTLKYETNGPESGRDVLFVHGYTMTASLWQPLFSSLAGTGLRCIAPTWPLGSQPEPIGPGAELTMRGVADMVNDLMEALSLDDVVLVGFDTGGVIAQLVAIHHPTRLGALVLTSCDAFENFPPPILDPFILASRTTFTFRAVIQFLRIRALRKRIFRDFAHRDIDDLASDWVRPFLDSPAIAEELRRLTGSLERQTTLDAAARLGEFTKPALIAWSGDDKMFPVEHAHRLAEILPNSDLHVVENALTMSMIDQPDRLAGLIAEFARAES